MYNKTITLYTIMPNLNYRSRVILVLTTGIYGFMQSLHHYAVIYIDLSSHPILNFRNLSMTCSHLNERGGLTSIEQLQKRSHRYILPYIIIIIGFVIYTILERTAYYPATTPSKLYCRSMK